MSLVARFKKSSLLFSNDFCIKVTSSEKEIANENASPFEALNIEINAGRSGIIN
jgi:hypothetical protein